MMKMRGRPVHKYFPSAPASDKKLSLNVFHERAFTRVPEAVLSVAGAWQLRSRALLGSLLLRDQPAPEYPDWRTTALVPQTDKIWGLNPFQITPSSRTTTVIILKTDFSSALALAFPAMLSLTSHLQRPSYAFGPQGAGRLKGGAAARPGPGGLPGAQQLPWALRDSHGLSGAPQLPWAARGSPVLPSSHGPPGCRVFCC